MKEFKKYWWFWGFLILMIFMISSCTENKQSTINRSTYYTTDSVYDSDNDDNIVIVNNKSIDDVIDDIDEAINKIDEKISSRYDGIVWRGEKIESKVGTFLYGMHELISTDKIGELETYQKNDNDMDFKVKFKHNRHKVDYFTIIESEKVIISYVDTVSIPQIIFSWDPEPGYKPSNNVEFLESTRGCIIILPIGYDRYKLSE